jgi:hypothetical protein
MTLAQHVRVRLVDDLDGSDAVATVSFSLDRHSFEIDLSERHVAEFHTALEPFVRAARRVSGSEEPHRIATPSEVGQAVAVDSPDPSRERASRGRRGRTAARRPDGGGSKPPREARVVTAPASTSTEPPPREPEAPARPESSPARPVRKRAPLVADPFNPVVRID